MKEVRLIQIKDYYIRTADQQKLGAVPASG